MEAQSSDSVLTPGGRKSAAVTGSARKLKDNAADWHNLILKWEKLNDEGSCVANRIVNLRLSITSQKEEQEMLMEDHASSPTSSSSPPGADRPGGHSRELEEECYKLLDVVDKMSRIVSKMEKLVMSERGIVELEAFQFGAAGRPTPLFHTWPTTRFAEVSTRLYESYGQELKLKRAVLQELAHTSSSDLSMVYLSCWLYQPYVDQDIRLLLEGLLLETGHRTL